MTENHFRRFWDLGYHRLLPVVPASVDMRNAGKRPGVQENGHWWGMGCKKFDATEQLLDVWHSMGAGVGIRNDQGNLGMDIDSLSTEWSSHIASVAREEFGDVPGRLGREPKILLPYRTIEPITYRSLRFNDGTEKGGLIELQAGVDSWYVAHGIHPTTQKPYRWPDGVPALADLPVVTKAQLDRLFDRLESELPAATRNGKNNTDRSRVNQESLKAKDLGMFARAMRSIPNKYEVIGGYDNWIEIIAAVRGACQDDYDLGLELMQEFAERSDLLELTEDTDRAYRTLPGPYGLGADYIYALAQRIGDKTVFDRGEVHYDPEGVEPKKEPGSIDFFDLSVTQQEEAKPKIPPLVAGRVTVDDLEIIPPRQWLYGNKVLRKYVTFIASPGGVGKTAMVIAMALACAAKQRLLHDDPRGLKPLRAWIFNLEDDMDELRRRLKAALKFYGLPPETLDYIRINSGRDRGIKILKLNKDGDFLIQPDYELVCAEIEREGIDILIVDPFLRSHGVPENANEAQDEVMRVFAQIAQRTGCGVVLVHHTKKGAIAGDMDSLRGGSTQGGGARAAFTLTAMSVEEAGKFGIPETDRRLYVRIDDAKNNMAPPANKAEWMKLNSVNLANGTEEYVAGDNVQVAAPWDPPSAWEGVLDQEDAILLRLEGGLADGERYSLRTQDKDRWAGLLLMEEFDKTPIQAKEILDAWQAEGKIETREYKSETQRKVRKGLFLTRPLAPKNRSGVFD